jgi:hypothetical protein
VIKLSILLYILRIIPKSARSIRIIAYCTALAVSILQIVQIAVLLCACRPAQAVYDLELRFQTFNCLNLNKVMSSLGAVWATTNVWTMVLAMPLAKTLPRSPNLVVRLIVIFGFGVLACAASVMRILFVGSAYYSWDPTWNSINVMICNQLEIMLGFIAASLPALNHIYAKKTPVNLSRLDQRNRLTSPIFDGPQCAVDQKSMDTSGIPVAKFPRRIKAGHLKLHSLEFERHHRFGARSLSVSDTLAQWPDYERPDHVVSEYWAARARRLREPNYYPTTSWQWWVGAETHSATADHESDRSVELVIQKPSPGASFVDSASMYSASSCTR